MSSEYSCLKSGPGLTRHPQDELLIVVALTRFSYQFEDAESGDRDRAWNLAVAIANGHCLHPRVAVTQLEHELFEDNSERDV